jgi:hypothetical protein
MLRTNPLDLERGTQKAYGSSVRRFRDATIEAECKSDYPHALHLNGVRALLKDDGGRVRSLSIGQRMLQLGSLSGGVSFFNAICRLLVYEESFSTRFSDLPTKPMQCQMRGKIEIIFPVAVSVGGGR